MSDPNAGSTVSDEEKKSGEEAQKEFAKPAATWDMFFLCKKDDLFFY